MRYAMLAVALLVSCLAAVPGHAGERDQLRFLIEDINVARGLQTQQKVPPVTSMPLVISQLTKLIDANRLSEGDMAAASYYRAEARRVINEVHRAKREPIDAVLTWDALADYDRVIAWGKDIPEWSVMIPEAENAAGSVAYLHAGAKEHAYAYWAKCAALEQAGCMNNMAGAKLTGDGGQSIDIPGAIELHSKVSATGTRYLCAGAFSALSIARIVELTGVKRPEDDGVAWAEKAHQLFDEVASRTHNPNMCGRSLFEIDEFLVRLSHHERREDLLRAVLDRPIDTAESSLVKFLLGESDEASARAALALGSLSSVLCGPHLHLLWFSELTGKHDSDAADLGYLRDHPLCVSEYALAKRFKAENEGH